MINIRNLLRFIELQTVYREFRTYNREFNRLFSREIHAVFFDRKEKPSRSEINVRIRPVLIRQVRYVIIIFRNIQAVTGQRLDLRYDLVSGVFILVLIEFYFKLTVISYVDFIYIYIILQITNH